MTEKPANIYDVARRAGVSIATVSRALSGGSVSAAAAGRVREAAAALDYRPVSHVQGRRMARSVALVISAQTNPYYASMCEGATAEAARSGYRLFTLNYPENTGCETVAEDLLTIRPAGALLAGFAADGGAAADTMRECLQRIQQNMPLVAIGPPVEGIECARLTSDPSQCVRKALAHLAMLGHRRIAFIGGDRSARVSVIRENAYHEEVRRLGCLEDPSYAVLTGSNAQAGELAMSILLGSHEARDYPTAVYAYNDLVALGALRHLQRSGLDVPRDMALVGCDNSFFARYLTPSLTTVDLHPYDHGRSAMAELIMSVNAGYPISFSQSFESSLIVRESCGAALGVRKFGG